MKCWRREEGRKGRVGEENYMRMREEGGNPIVRGWRRRKGN